MGISFCYATFFQWVSMGMPGVFRDRREDDLKEIESGQC